MGQQGALRLVRPEGTVAVPWYRRRWVHITGAVLWWLLTFVWGLAVAVVAVVLFMLGALMMFMGVMNDLVGRSR
jgi:hypothetical protein